MLQEKVSAYRKDQSLETALRKVLSDILAGMGSQHVLLLVMLDRSTAFDTMNREMLCDKLQSRFGICGTVLDRFRSYLDERKERVIVNNTVSEEMHLNRGVPPGSCSVPALFFIFHQFFI